MDELGECPFRQELQKLVDFHLSNVHKRFKGHIVEDYDRYTYRNIIGSSILESELAQKFLEMPHEAFTPKGLVSDQWD